MATPKRPRFRRDLSAPGLVSQVRSCFERVRDPLRSRKASLADHMMAAFAMFILKFPSMLAFDRSVRGKEPDPNLIGNLKALFGLGHVPCDTAMRERLDAVDPEALRPAFKAVFSKLQRGKGLEGLARFGGHYLVAIDGTEYFKSESISCNSCCVRRKRNGAMENYHQMLCASVVDPAGSAAFPLVLPEMVRKADGASKNDCETNALKRLLPAMRREHPHLKMAVLLDALHGKAPQVRMLRDLGMNFLIGVKRKDHQILFGQLETDGESHKIVDEDGTVRRFRWRNGAELNNSNRDILVNALEYSETKPARKVRKSGGRTREVKAKTVRFAWVTDLGIDRGNLEAMVRVGRSRWRIENNVFNTMKNQNYNLERNYGHGDRNLCPVLASIMALAFLVDQVQERCCRVFQSARRRFEARTALWERMRAVVTLFRVRSWEDFFLEHLISNREREPPKASA